MGIKLKTFIKWFIMLWGTFSIGDALACTNLPADHIIIEDNGMKVAINILPDSLAVGEITSLSLIICDHNEQPFVGDVKATAIMPAHNHGMNYKPRFNMVRPGQYTGTGFLFHMPGAWQIQLSLHWDGKTQRIVYDVHL